MFVPKHSFIRYHTYINPKSATKIFKRKRCRMFWNGKICILLKTFVKYIHLGLFYVLDYSGSFDICISKIIKKKLFVSPVFCKKCVLLWGWRGAQNLTDWSTTKFFVVVRWRLPSYIDLHRLYVLSFMRQAHTSKNQ